MDIKNTDTTDTVKVYYVSIKSNSICKTEISFAEYDEMVKTYRSMSANMKAYFKNDCSNFIGVVLQYNELR